MRTEPTHRSKRARRSDFYTSSRVEATIRAFFTFSPSVFGVISKAYAIENGRKLHVVDPFALELDDPRARMLLTC